VTENGQRTNRRWPQLSGDKALNIGFTKGEHAMKNNKGKVSLYWVSAALQPKSLRKQDHDPTWRLGANAL
jgi:hypothetical protein